MFCISIHSRTSALLLLVSMKFARTHPVTGSQVMDMAANIMVSAGHEFLICACLALEVTLNDLAAALWAGPAMGGASG